MNASSQPDIHIVSCVVFCQPEYQLDIVVATEAMGLEVSHAHGAPGKLVVLMEADSTQQVQTTIQGIQAFIGVLTVTMVYHHVEKESELKQELICP